MLAGDHDVQWSCTSLRKGLTSLRAGMVAHRHLAQGEPVGHWLEQARASPGRYRPTLSVGREGIFGPLHHQGWQAGATALSRGSIAVGHVSGQGSWATCLRQGRGP